MSRNISLRDFDWTLIAFVLIICTLGVIEIRSATLHTKFAGVHIRQMYWIAGGLAGMFVVSLLNYHALLERVHWMYIAALASLMTVLVFGQKYLGARRWVKLPGGNHFQPSEWVKLVLILAVAKYFADLQHREAEPKPRVPADTNPACEPEHEAHRRRREQQHPAKPRGRSAQLSLRRGECE